MISSILVLTLAGRGLANDETKLQTLIARSNECLIQEVNKLVPANKCDLTNEERSVTRIAAVNACDHFNGEIASYTADYRSKNKPLVEVSEEMRIVSLRIADTLAVTRAKQNTNNRNQNAQD